MLSISVCYMPPMDIELRLLRSFVAIYERGSLSRAAEQLLCTQAAMSMRLKMLEDSVGNRLFLRHHHRLEPTSLGSEFYAKALGVLATYDEMISTTRSRTVIEKVRIGVPDDYALGILTGVIQRLRSEFSAIELEIVCDLSANLVAALRRQDLDLTLATLAAPSASAVAVVETRLCWVQHPEYRHDARLPVALSAYPEGCVFRKAMISSLEAAKMPWRVMTQSRSHAGVMSAVRAAAAVTSMAEGTVPPDLVARTKADWLPRLNTIPIYLMRREGAPGGAATRIEAAISDQLVSADSTA